MNIMEESSFILYPSLLELLQIHTCTKSTSNLVENFKTATNFTMSSPKILLTGSTGFIGGSILTKLVESGITAKYPVSVIVRGEDKAKALKAKYGVKTYLFHSLDEADLLREIAGEHDSKLLFPRLFYLPIVT